ncbi:MAG: hypothetical protein JFT09_11220 [Muribaculaceae bacterium]|jgi:hypothetical protein|nr:hypothetical protein [Muribaculaceae bacterium]
MYDSGLEACRNDLYTDSEQLYRKYPDALARKIERVREMHQWFLSNPAAKDAVFVSECVSRFGISRPTAYSDLSIVKALLPHLSSSSKEFDRWRFRQMTLRTFEIAEARKDARSMAQAAANYARYLNIDKEDESDIPVDQIIPQPFVPTDDPSVLGIRQIPNIRERIRELTEKYIKEIPDIEDIEAEDADLDENNLFGPLPENPDTLDPVDA